MTELKRNGIAVVLGAIASVGLISAAIRIAEANGPEWLTDKSDNLGTIIAALLGGILTGIVAVAAARITIAPALRDVQISTLDHLKSVVISLDHEIMFVTTARENIDMRVCQLQDRARTFNSGDPKRISSIRDFANPDGKLLVFQHINQWANLTGTLIDAEIHRLHGSTLFGATEDLNDFRTRYIRALSKISSDIYIFKGSPGFLLEPRGRVAIAQLANSGLHSQIEYGSSTERYWRGLALHKSFVAGRIERIYRTAVYAN